MFAIVGEQALAIGRTEARIRLVEVNVEIRGILLFRKNERIAANERRNVTAFPLSLGGNEKIFILPDTDQRDRKKRASFPACKCNRILARGIEKLNRGERYRIGVLGEVEIAAQSSESCCAVLFRVELNRLLVKEQSRHWILTKGSSLPRSLKVNLSSCRIIT